MKKKRQRQDSTPTDRRTEHGVRRQERTDVDSPFLSEAMAEWRRRDAEAVRAGWGRRAFLRMLGLGTATIALIANIGGTRSLLKEFFDADADEQLLREIFGVGTSISAALVPAANHPWKRPPEGMNWYPIEEACCDAFRSRFLRNARLRTVTGFPQIRRDNTLYLFGSQVSNIIARYYLGHPIRQEPNLAIQTADWRASLRWNLHTPVDAPSAERIQYGELWTTKKHVIVDRNGEQIEACSISGVTQDDYLLLTVLPRFSTGPERVFIFGGIHGPGTRAAGLLFAVPPVTSLRRLLRDTRSEPYYQALFHVRVERIETGEYQPTGLELVGAEPLKDLEFR